MSWTTFKSTLLPAMQSNLFGNNINGFAKAFTTAYDIAIKSGKETINPIPLLKGNPAAMEAQLISFLTQTQMSKSLTLLDVIGPAIISYWAGGTMAPIPPLIPAPGAIANIVLTQGTVLNPGTWSPIPVPPNNDSSVFLNAFITAAKIHLSTVSGLYVVLAQYPPPAPPAPGVLPWSGYVVPD
jgi:hypothetical protein